MANPETSTSVYGYPESTYDDFSHWIVIDDDGTRAMTVDISTYSNTTFVKATAAYTGSELTLDEQGELTGNLSTHDAISGYPPQISYAPGVLGNPIECVVKPPLTNVERKKAAATALVVSAWRLSDESQRLQASLDQIANS